MSRSIANAAAVIAGVLLAIAILEVGLRLWPSAISMSALANFDTPLRREIAELLDLPLKQARRCIGPNERSDQGPELCLIAPYMQFRQPVDPADLAEGAEAVLPHDARGFCNPPAKADRPQAILVSIGDSFTWCTTVPPEATFTSLLEAKLGVTTYNLGVPGVGPYEYLEILRRFGLPLKPRIVLLNIYEGNDLRDAVRFAEQRAAGAPAAEGQDRAAPGLWDRLRELPMRHSYALNFIVGASEAVLEQWRPLELDFRYEITVRGSRRIINEGQSDHDEVRDARRMLSGDINLSLWDQALDDFATLAAKHRFVPVVTYVPAAYTAYATTVAFTDSSIGKDLAAKSQAQRTYLRQKCADLELVWIDLTEPIQTSTAMSDLAYFPYNLHLTQVGHTIVADALAPRLQPLLNSSVTGDRAGSVPTAPVLRADAGHSGPVTK